MALKITSSDLAERRALIVDEAGVRFQEGVLYTGTRRIPFADIEAIVLSPKGLLCIQAGQRLHKIQTKVGDRRHREVIDALVSGAKAASAR
jgi:hypothetical protein